MAILNNSTDIISYNEVELTIRANSVFTYENPYNFVRLLESTGSNTALMFRFGVSSIETFLSKGIGLGFTELLPSLTIRNTTNTPVKIKVAEMRGAISDDRLVVSGQVETLEQPYTVRQATQETFDANGEIAVDSSNYKRVLIQNNGTGPIYLFQNGLFEIDPKGTFDLNYAGQFTVYGTASENISLAYFN